MKIGRDWMEKMSMVMVMEEVVGVHTMILSQRWVQNLKEGEDEGKIGICLGLHKELWMRKKKVEVEEVC